MHLLIVICLLIILILNDTFTKVIPTNSTFWNNIKRTELYEMMENSIPEMHIFMPNATWNEMVKNAQIKKQKQITHYKTMALLKFIYKGKEESYNIQIKLGGKGSTTFSKPGYNIKIKDENKSLHGTKDFRLRSDQPDPTMLGTKLATDVLLKSGLIANEAGYTDLYINDNYMGFWVVIESIGDDWIKRNINNTSEPIKTLYQCKDDFIRFEDGSAKKKCTNSNKNYTDYMEPFNTFVDQVNNATTRNDLEKIMDVDNFIKYMAWEWLIGTWDHFLGIYGHNLYWFQQPNGKWIYIPYDYGEHAFGSDQGWYKYPKKAYFKKVKKYYLKYDYSYISFKEFELDHPIIKILINDDDTIFRNLLGDIISKIFNPDTLLLRIDELVKLIAPYVEKDRKLNAGKINKKGKDFKYNFKHFKLNLEYTYLFFGSRKYGLKDWIHRRYNFAASYYGINTNSTLPEKKHKLIEPRPKPIIIPCKMNARIIKEKPSDKVYIIDLPNKLPEYTPDENYEDNSIPNLGVNQYNLGL